MKFFVEIKIPTIDHLLFASSSSMPFSHHSHSGQFCQGHAKDSLEHVIQTAIAKKMQTFCLTEHMPREKIDFYPEEVCV